MEQEEKKKYVSWTTFISIRKTFASAFILSNMQEERLSAFQELMSNTLEYCYGLKGRLMNTVPVEGHNPN